MIIFVVVINPRFVTDRLEMRSQQLDAEGILYKRDGMVDRVLEPLKIMHGFDFIIGIGMGLEHSLIGNRPNTLIKQHKPILTIEVHNMFGDVFRTHGLIGLFLFGIWIGKILKMSTKVKDGLWIMLCLLLYNMASNGIRFRYFWIFLAFLMAIINHSYNKRNVSNIDTVEKNPDRSIGLQ